MENCKAPCSDLVRQRAEGGTVYLGREKGLTWYFHSEEGKNFNYKYRNPADGIREHYKKEAVCNSHLWSNVIPHF